MFANRPTCVCLTERSISSLEFDVTRYFMSICHIYSTIDAININLLTARSVILEPTNNY